jgi:hypothetical protein
MHFVLIFIWKLSPEMNMPLPHTFHANTILWLLNMWKRKIWIWLAKQTLYKINQFITEKSSFRIEKQIFARVISKHRRDESIQKGDNATNSEEP